MKIYHASFSCSQRFENINIEILWNVVTGKFVKYWKQKRRNMEQKLATFNWVL